MLCHVDLQQQVVELLSGDAIATNSAAIPPMKAASRQFGNRAGI